MRSGVGGVVQATAECTRHGRFVATRAVRVPGDGCATAPERVARERSGNPKLRLARVPRLGEIVEVRTKLDHDSDTGLSLKGGVYVRERPEFFVKQVRVYFDRDLVAHFTLTSAISANPILRFPAQGAAPGRAARGLCEQRGATLGDHRAGAAGGMRVSTSQQPPARIGERRARAYVA